MYHRRAKSLLTVLLTGLCIKVFAQTNGSGSNPINGKENNPYSKYGLGELSNGNNTVLRGMGNITSAYANPYQANTDNPASYSYLKRTTFEVGAQASGRTIHGKLDGADVSYKSGTASVAYMNLAFPVSKNAGMILGFRPYAHTFYRLEDTLTTTTVPASPIGSVIRRYEGQGGLNDAFLGGSFKFKGLSLGINAGYLFGTTQQTDVLLPFDTLTINNAFSSEFTKRSRIGGLHWKGGLMYEAKLDSTHVLRVGGTVGMSQKVNEHYSEYHLARYYYGDTIIRDTNYNVAETKGKLTLPLTYSIGVMLSRTGKWGVGLDYTATQWNLFSSELNTSMNAGIASSSYKASLGGEYTPDAGNIKKYLSRATYRLGAYYGTDYLQLQSQTLPYYGITAGFSLPFKRSLSEIHAAIDGGVLGTTNNGLTRQNYIRVTLGLTFNDLWFIKRRLD
jgi:hypothetical protein